MGDLISRDTLIAEIKRVYCTGCNSYEGVRCRACGTGDALDMVEDAPAVNERRGYWISVYGIHGKLGEKCSNCGRRVKNGGENFCPKCGAIMDGD